VLILRELFSTPACEPFRIMNLWDRRQYPLNLKTAVDLHHRLQVSDSVGFQLLRSSRVWGKLLSVQLLAAAGVDMFGNPPTAVLRLNQLLAHYLRPPLPLCGRGAVAGIGELVNSRMFRVTTSAETPSVDRRHQAENGPLVGRHSPGSEVPGPCAARRISGVNLETPAPGRSSVSL